MYHSTYRGCNISRNTRPGPYLRWETYAVDHFVYADTLAGIKEAIREALGVKKIIRDTRDIRARRRSRMLARLTR